MKRITDSKGYTLLFAIIVSTVVLSVAVFILNISRKQFILASAARDSTVAFYAADSGVECAMEAASIGQLTPATVGGSGSVPTITCGTASSPMPQYSSLTSSPPGMNFQCGGGTNCAPTPISQATMVFPFGTTCAKLMVTYGTNLTGGTMTVIDSNGYNVNCSGGNPIPGPRDENRWIRVIENN